MKDSLPPIPDDEIAASAALRKRMEHARKAWKIGIDRIAGRSGFSRVTVSSFARGTTQIGPHPAFYVMIEAALDALIREELRKALAQVDPEFAAWDAPRRRRETNAIPVRNKLARKEALKLAEDAVAS